MAVGLDVMGADDAAHAVVCSAVAAMGSTHEVLTPDLIQTLYHINAAMTRTCAFACSS